MKAAIVEDYKRPPRYTECDDPIAGDNEVVVTVAAAALSQLVRAQSLGKHYSSPTVPFVPGVDGVGTLENGQRVYFAFPKAPAGAMAEKVVVQKDYTVALPDEVDNVMAAAIANPGMSSWAALTERAFLKKGESVLVNGATGASGRLAIQIAKQLGAGRVIATGRNPDYDAELLALGADTFVPLAQSPEALTDYFRREIAEGVDVVLDYLWGPTAVALMTAAADHAEGEAGRRIRFVNIGGLGGAVIDLPAAALRSSGLELMGSGLGSVSNAALVKCIGEMFKVIHSANLQVDAMAVPLTDVETAWTGSGGGRIVFTL